MFLPEMPLKIPIWEMLRFFVNQCKEKKSSGVFFLDVHTFSNFFWLCFQLLKLGRRSTKATSKLITVVITFFLRFALSWQTPTL